MNANAPGSQIGVAAFRAIGDGVADDTTAIQKAITAAAGATAIFEAGIYKTTRCLYVPSHTGVLFQDGSAIITGNTASFNIGDTDGDGIQLNGEPTPPETTSRSANVDITNNITTDNARYGIYVGGSWSVNITENQMQNNPGGSLYLTGNDQKMIGNNVIGLVHIGRNEFAEGHNVPSIEIACDPSRVEFK